jgi:hypothetical protein
MLLNNMLYASVNKIDDAKFKDVMKECGITEPEE